MADTTPVPQPPTQPKWMQILLLVVAAYAAFLQGKSNVPPDNKPAPIVVPPPAPAPIVDPPPVPRPDDTPVDGNSLSITDSQGRQILGAVKVGRHFHIVAPTGTSIVAIPQPTDASGEVTTVSDREIVCTLYEGGSLQVISYSVGKPTIFMVHSNQAPQPPPSPPSPDVTPPIPAPIPVQKTKVNISIIEDAPNRPADVAIILNDFKFWEAIRIKGNKVRIWNGGADPSPEPEAKADAALVAGNLPGLVIRRQSDNSVVYAGKMTTVKPELEALIGRFVE